MASDPRHLRAELKAAGFSVARALSVHYFASTLMKDLGCGLDDTVNDVISKIKQKGQTKTCPRDGRMGVAYVDAVEDKYAGRANMMLSYSWRNKVSDIVSALKAVTANTDPKGTRTRVWICCLCINQHRVPPVVSTQDFMAIFGDQIKRAGHLVCLLTPWYSPLYITRCWCLFESWLALAERFVKVDFVLPENERRNFLASLTEKSESGSGLDRVWKALASIKVENAGASLPADKRNILRLIESSCGFSEMNQEITSQLQSWFVDVALSSNSDPARFSPNLYQPIAEMMLRLNKLDDAKRVCDEGILQLQANGTGGLKLALLTLSLGRAHGIAGDQNVALKLCCLALERCTEVREKSGALQGLEEAGCYRTIAAIYRKQDRMEEARNTYLRSLRIFEQPRYVAEARRQVAALKKQENEKGSKNRVGGESNEAKPEEECLMLDAAWILLNLGMVTCALNRHKKDFNMDYVGQCYSRALNIYRQHEQLNSDSAAHVYRSLGVLHAYLGRTECANEAFQAAEQIYRTLCQTSKENFAELCKSQGLLELQRHGCKVGVKKILTEQERDSLGAARAELRDLEGAMLKATTAVKAQRHKIRMIMGETSGSIEAAEEFLDESASILRRLMPPQKRIDSLLTELASLYTERGDTASASEAMNWIYYRGQSPAKMIFSCERCKEEMPAACVRPVMHVRIMCIALDSTLLDSKSQISRANADAIANASRAGYTIIFCSELGSTMCVPTASALGVRGGLFLVACNGAAVYRLGQSGKIKETLLEAKLTSASIDKLVALGVNCAIAVDIDKVQYAQFEDDDGQEQTEARAKHMQVKTLRVDSIQSIDGPNKLTIFTPNPQSLVDQARATAHFLEDGIDVVVGGPTWVETVVPGHDRASGVRLVCDYLGAQLENCVYFGIGKNDILALKQAGLGIATQNATPEAKAAAHRVSRWSNDENAIANEIEKVLADTETARVARAEADV